MHTAGRRLSRLLVGAAVIAATGMSVPTAATAAPAGTTGPTENYLVLFKGSSSPAAAASIVSRAGGTVVANYSKIGVLVARSDNTAFGQTVRANNKVEGADATTDFATKLEPAAADAAQPRGPAERAGHGRRHALLLPVGHAPDAHPRGA